MLRGIKQLDRVQVIGAPHLIERLDSLSEPPPPLQHVDITILRCFNQIPITSIPAPFQDTGTVPRLLPCFDGVDPSPLQSVFANRCGRSTTNPQQAHAFLKIPPGTFLDHESVPVIADLEANAQFGEEDYGVGSNLAEIAGQLPATTFWAFAREFFGKVPELFLR